MLRWRVEAHGKVQVDTKVEQAGANGGPRGPYAIG